MALDIQDLIRQREESRQLRNDVQPVRPAPQVPAPSFPARRTTTRTTVEENGDAEEYDLISATSPKKKQPEQPAPKFRDKLRLHKAVKQYRDDPLDDREPPGRKRSRLGGVRTFLSGCGLVALPAIGAVASIYFATTKLKGEADFFISVQMLHLSQAIICIQFIITILYLVVWKRRIEPT